MSARLPHVVCILFPPAVLIQRQWRNFKVVRRCQLSLLALKWDQIDALRLKQQVLVLTPCSAACIPSYQLKQPTFVAPFCML